MFQSNFVRNNFEYALCSMRIRVYKMIENHSVRKNILLNYFSSLASVRPRMRFKEF